jgi:hypothetical protein
LSIVVASTESPKSIVDVTQQLEHPLQIIDMPDTEMRDAMSNL